MTAALMLLAHALSAQSPAERGTVDSLVRDVELSQRTGATVDVNRMHRAEAAFADGVDHHDKWVAAWYGLGIARLELARADVLAREGPELPIGMNNASGAEHAFLRAIQLDRTFKPAAEALALAPTAREPNGRFRERVAGLRPVYLLLSGPASAAAAYPEREAGSVDSAVALEERALVRGGIDSAVVMLALARDLFQVRAPQEGRHVLIAAAATKSGLGQKAYREELAWVASPGEMAEWDSLSADARPAWVTNFWAKRDIAEGRRDGARLEEHYRRIEYAMKNFRISLPKTGRQQFVSMTPSLSDGYDAELAARKTITANSTAYPDAAKLLLEARTIGSESPSRYYHAIQDLVNDKGIVWIRHGPPTKMSHNSLGPPFEIWRYERPEGQLVLYFRQADFEGSSMPNELVPTLLDASPVILNQLCMLDTTLCPTTTGRVSFKAMPPYGSLVDQIQGEIKSAGSLLSPEALHRSADRGKAFIDLATTTDTYHRDFEHAMRPLVQILGLDRAGGGSPRMVVAFAIPGSDMMRTVVDGRNAYHVQLQLMAASARDGRRIELDTLRRFVTNAPLTGSQYLTGLVELPVSAGRYSVSVVFSQSDGHGAIAHLGEIVVPGNSATLAISDLVLGQSGSGAHWNSGTTDVPLNPLGTYSRGGNAETYFQLSGLNAGSSYTVRFDISRANDDAKTAPRLSVSSQLTATGPRMEVSRSLGLANLDPAKYRVQLTVTGGGASVGARAWLTVVK